MQLETTGEMARVPPTLVTRMKHIEELLTTKASHEDFTRRTEELLYQLARKTDASDFRDALQALRGEVQVRGVPACHVGNGGPAQAPLTTLHCRRAFQ